MKTREACKTG